MRTNIGIDDELLSPAMARAGAPTTLPASRSARTIAAASLGVANPKWRTCVRMSAGVARRSSRTADSMIAMSSPRGDR
jgi:hypothetical protein